MALRVGCARLREGRVSVVCPLVAQTSATTSKPQLCRRQPRQRPTPCLSVSAGRKTAPKSPRNPRHLCLQLALGDTVHVPPQFPSPISLAETSCGSLDRADPKSAVVSSLPVMAILPPAAAVRERVLRSRFGKVTPSKPIANGSTLFFGYSWLLFGSFLDRSPSPVSGPAARVHVIRETQRNFRDVSFSR